MSQETSDQRRIHEILPYAKGASGKISQSHAYIISALIALGLGVYHWFYEGWRENIIFAASITAALIAAMTFATRRLLMSVATVAAIVAMIVVAADVKRRYIEMVLHAYDVVFYLTSWATIRFLWVDHRAYLIAIAIWPDDWAASPCLDCRAHVPKPPRISTTPTGRPR